MSILLTPALAKAARALLEWQQKDLAREASLSMTAVNHFERGIGTARDATLLALMGAFEANGIEFLPQGGLRHNEDIAAVNRYGGNDFIAKWCEDIFAAVRAIGDTIMTSSIDETLWYQPNSQTATEDYMQWAARLNLNLKSLVPQGRKTLRRPHIQYRAIAPEMIGKISYCIYADRLAFILWKKKQIIVLRNALVAETFRNQFSYLWKLGKPL